MNAKSSDEHKWRKENPPSTKINLKVSFRARLQLVALATATIVIIILIPAQLALMVIFL
jgi:hypothetical protein